MCNFHIAQFAFQVPQSVSSFKESVSEEENITVKLGTDVMFIR